MTNPSPRLLLIIAVLASTGCSVLGKVERPPVRGIDLNAATAEEIAALPGLSQAEAERIVRERPYASEDDIVRRGLVTHEQLAGFEEQTYVGRPRVENADACPPLPARP